MKRAPGYRARERAHFDRLASEQQEIWWGSGTPAGVERLRRRARMLAESLQAYPAPRVLEVGCGTGAFSLPVLEEMPSLQLTGCDISPVSIELARAACARFPHAAFSELDATEMPYEASSFDAVIGNSILHHLPLESTLEQCFRVLAPGGLLWFSEPNMMNPQIALERNVRFVGERLQNSEDETAFFRWPLARLLRRIGFIDVVVRPYDFMHPLVPESILGTVDRLGRLLERMPGIREIAGSLVIQAARPPD